MSSFSSRVIDSELRESFFGDWMLFIFFLSAEPDAGESSNSGTVCPCFLLSFAIVFEFSFVSGSSQLPFSELADAEHQERLSKCSSCAELVTVRLKICPARVILP